MSPEFSALFVVSNWFIVAPIIRSGWTTSAVLLSTAAVSLLEQVFMINSIFVLYVVPLIQDITHFFWATDPRDMFHAVSLCSLSQHM